MNRDKSNSTSTNVFSRLWVILLFAAGVIVQVLLLVMQENRQFETVNLVITIIFFLILLVIFIIIFRCIGKGLRFRKDLENATDRIISLSEQHENDEDEDNSEILEDLFQQKLFHTRALTRAFAAYRQDVNKMRDNNSPAAIDIENYINQDLLDEEISMHFLNQIPGAMTGLGILGTFVGLSLGLNSFNFQEAAYNMTSELQPLMDGIKVAFHTSIIGLIYSLGFSFFFSKQLAGHREAVDEFLDTYRNYVVPVTEDGSTGTFIKYQQSIVELLKEQSDNQQYQQQTLIPELQKMSRAVTTYAEENQRTQEEQLERIVNQFIERMNASLGYSFRNLQDVINSTNENQRQILRELKTSMNEISRMTYDLQNVNQSMEQSVKQVTAYLELVNSLQATAQSNLESLNAQTDYNNKILTSERTLLTSITESTGKTSKAMTEFLNKASAQTTAIQKTSERVDRLSSHIENVADQITEQNNQMYAAMTQKSAKAAGSSKSVTRTGSLK